MKYKNIHGEKIAEKTGGLAIFCYILKDKEEQIAMNLRLM